MTTATTPCRTLRRTVCVSLHDQVWTYISHFGPKGAPFGAIISRFIAVPLCDLEEQLRLLVAEGLIEKRNGDAPNKKYVAVVQLAVYAWVKVAA